MLREFLETSTWCFVHDKEQLSGKKRKAKGLDPLKQETNVISEESFQSLAWKQLAQAWPEFAHEESDFHEF